jgi:hypothetical protein
MMSYLINFEGNYSWYYNSELSILKNLNWINLEKLPYDVKNKIYQGNDILKQTDLSIDKTVDKITVDNYSNFWWPGFQEPAPYSLEYYSICKKSFCSVVNETRFAYPFGNFSEKTLAAINSKIPFIVVSSPYTLEYLKKLGFKTFKEFWDESYDTEEDHGKRLLKIFKVIEYIDSLSINQLKDMYSLMYKTLNYNSLVFKKLKSNKLIFR